MDTPLEYQTLSYTGKLSSLVGVQPMNGPVGLCYVMRYKNPSELPNVHPMLNGETNPELQLDNGDNSDTQLTMQPLILEISSIAVQASTFKLQCDMNDQDKINGEIDTFLVNKILKAKEPTILKTSTYNEILNVVTYKSSQIAATTRRGFGNVIFYNQEDTDLMEYIIAMTKKKHQCEQL